MPLMIAISLCMIVKNEERKLANCLDSVLDYIDEIIIADTGSTDKTKGIARRYTDKLYDYKWNNNFSEARNYAISKAHNEYILVLDGDEIIESIDMNLIERLINQKPKQIGRLLCINEYNRKGIDYKYKERVSRLFSKNYFKYEGMIHEQLEPYDNCIVETYNAPIKIIHSGYGGTLEERKNKALRNINLLKQALKKQPNDPYILYQLGKSYYMEEDYVGSCKFLGEALYCDLNPGLEYVQDMIESYGYSLLNTGQYEIALQLLNVYDEFSQSADFIFLIALVLMNNGKYQEAIDEFLKAAKKEVCKMEGVNDYLAFYNIGVIYECLGDINRAKTYYNKCGNYNLAVLRNKILLTS